VRSRSRSAARKCWLPSNSMMSLCLGAQKSTMYRPTACCLRKLTPRRRPLRRYAHEQSLASAGSVLCAARRTGRITAGVERRTGMDARNCSLHLACSPRASPHEGSACLTNRTRALPGLPQMKFSHLAVPGRAASFGEVPLRAEGAADAVTRGVVHLVR